MASVQIRAVQSKKELSAFIRLPWKIYAGDPNWVPPLLMDMKKLLDRKKNPFFQHSEAEFFLAWRHGEVVGRVEPSSTATTTHFITNKSASSAFLKA